MTNPAHHGFRELIRLAPRSNSCALESLFYVAGRVGLVVVSDADQVRYSIVFPFADSFRVFDERETAAAWTEGGPDSGTLSLLEDADLIGKLQARVYARAAPERSSHYLLVTDAECVIVVGSRAHGPVVTRCDAEFLSIDVAQD
jgi:hypothetical protein